MNNEQKLQMINMCTTALLESKQLEYLDGESWVDSDNDIGDIVCNIFDYDTQYRVKPEPEKKLFVPFKGQIVQSMHGYTDGMHMSIIIMFF